MKKAQTGQRKKQSQNDAISCDFANRLAQKEKTQKRNTKARARIRDRIKPYDVFQQMVWNSNRKHRKGTDRSEQKTKQE